MNTQRSIEFPKTVSPIHAMETVRTRGACAVHSFATAAELEAAARRVRTERMFLDIDTTGHVKRRQQMAMYAFRGTHTPDEFTLLATQIATFVNRGQQEWTPNEVIAHRYDYDDFIGMHRDFTQEAYGVIAVLTLDGEQDFHVMLDDEQDPTTITMHPGTLTMLRGYTGDPEKRPLHAADRPVKPRTALSIRDNRRGEHRVWTAPSGGWE